MAPRRSRVCRRTDSGIICKPYSKTWRQEKLTTELHARIRPDITDLPKGIKVSVMEVDPQLNLVGDRHELRGFSRTIRWGQ